MNVNEIKFSSSLFDMLVILTEKKKIIMSLTESCISLTKKKKVVMFLSEKSAQDVSLVDESEKMSEESHVSSVNDAHFEDIIIKKEWEVIIFLQYDLIFFINSDLNSCAETPNSDSLSIEKTATAEAIAEHLKWSLYSVCTQCLVIFIFTNTFRCFWETWVQMLKDWNYNSIKLFKLLASERQFSC